MANVQRKGFTFHKLADYNAGRKVDRDGTALEAWPLLGVEFVDGPPEYAVIPESVLVAAYKEGWVELENPSIVVRPAGPAHAPFAGQAGTGKNHEFLHADSATFKMVDGDYRYKIVQNPDKQHVNRIATGGDVEAGDVWHDYLLDLEASPEIAG